MINAKGYFEGHDPFSNLIDIEKKVSLGSEDLAPYLDAETASVRVVDASEFRQEVKDYFANPDHLEGAKLPWGKTHNDLRFRAGETTVWAGINAHGKSLLAGFVSIGFVAQGEKVLNISLEMTARNTLIRMAKQITHVSNPTPEAIDNMFDFLVAEYFIYRYQGSMHEKYVYAAIRYASAMGIRHVIVDNMAKCISGDEDSNTQKAFINSVTELAQQYNVHCHIIHHIKKLETETRLPNKFDVKGSGTITDLPDQVLLVYKHVAKIKAMQLPPDSDQYKKFENAPDAFLICEKNRHGDWEGTIPLWFNKTSGQFTADSRRMNIEITQRQTFDGISSSRYSQ